MSVSLSHLRKKKPFLRIRHRRHIVVYKQAETKTKELVGRVACRLSAENYGASEWWLLLEPQM